MKNENNKIVILIFYFLSLILIDIQTLFSIINSFASSEFFDFGLEEQIVLYIHIIQVIANIIYLVIRNVEPEKWMTIINYVVSLLTLNLSRAVFAIFYAFYLIRGYNINL